MVSSASHKECKSGTDIQKSNILKLDFGSLSKTFTSDVRQMITELEGTELGTAQPQPVLLYYVMSVQKYSTKTGLRKSLKLLLHGWGRSE